MTVSLSEPLSDERRAQQRLRSIRKAQSARAAQVAAQHRQDARAWRDWLSWCAAAARAYGELRRARESGDPRKVARAVERDRDVVRAMPAIPRGRRP